MGEPREVDPMELLESILVMRRYLLHLNRELARELRRIDAKRATFETEGTFAKERFKKYRQRMTATEVNIIGLTACRLYELEKEYKEHAQTRRDPPECCHIL